MLQEIPVETSPSIASLHDNGGRRSGFERRQFSYSGYIPERRILADRRRGFDRRKNPPVIESFIIDGISTERRQYST